MGFGSYDETEQEKQDIGTVEDGGENVRESIDHSGNVSFDVGDTDELIDRLGEIKKDDEDDD